MTEDGWRVWMEGGVVGGGGAPRDWMGPYLRVRWGVRLVCAFGRVRRTTAVVIVVFGAAEHLR